MLTRCGVPLPVYFLAAEKHSRCLTAKVYLPAMVQGRVIWHLRYTTEARTVAFTQSYQEFQRAAVHPEPSYRVKGVLIDGFDSTTRVCGRCSQGRTWALACATRSSSSRRTWWPSVLLSVRHSARRSTPSCTEHGSARACACLHSASGYATLPTTSPLRRGRPTVHVYGVGFSTSAGWYAVLAAPQMPATSTLLDQSHNAMERKLFAMKGFHHPKGSQQVFLTGLAHLYKLVPYQRRAQHASQCGVEVQGGTVPTRDWFLNLQILTSGGFR